MCEVQEKSENH